MRQLPPGEDQALLVWRDAVLVLDINPHVVDGVGVTNGEHSAFGTNGGAVDDKGGCVGLFASGGIGDVTDVD